MTEDERQRRYGKLRSLAKDRDFRDMVKFIAFLAVIYTITGGFIHFILKVW